MRINVFSGPACLPLHMMAREATITQNANAAGLPPPSLRHSMYHLSLKYRLLFNIDQLLKSPAITTRMKTLMSGSSQSVAAYPWRKTYHRVPDFAAPLNYLYNPFFPSESLAERGSVLASEHTCDCDPSLSSAPKQSCRHANLSTYHDAVQ